MTAEARIAFIVFFFAVWFFVGLLVWAVGAVIMQGRGALVALPGAISAACAAGVAVPLLGLDDATGFFVSLGTAAIGGAIGAAGGIAVAVRSSEDATDDG